MDEDELKESVDAKADEGKEDAANAAEANPDDGGAHDGGKAADDGPGGRGETVNRHKYEREMKARDEKIAELQAKLDEQARTEEGRTALKEEMERLKAEMADERIAHRLELAGCRDVKAAKSRLDDFDGDVAKLKAECPYLFEEERKTGTTGKRPDGPADDVDARLDKAMGIG